jgi:hypothetical protein
MVAFITLADAKQHLRVDHNDDDADIQLKISEASEIVLNYCKKTIGTPDPSDPSIVDWAEGNLPGNIRAATELMLSKLYDDRAAAQISVLYEQVALGYLPLSVTALLHRYRDPALA